MTKASKDKVIFLRGTYEEYASLPKKDPNTIYFILDTHEIYVGEQLYTTVNYNNLINLPDLTLYVQKDGNKVLSDFNFSQEWINKINAQKQLTPEEIKRMISLSDYIKTQDADNKYQPKGNYLTASDIENKVDKIAGKGLSTNDFTNDLKTKLENTKNIYYYEIGE